MYRANANSTVLILHRHAAIGITIAESIGTRRSQICPFAGREQQASDMQTSECRRRGTEGERERGGARRGGEEGGTVYIFQIEMLTR